MSADRFSLSEFSQFLDDTDGHRLAQFLQKKSGAVRPGRGRIFDREPERFSLNVRLKRLSSPPLAPPPQSAKEVIEEQPENVNKTQKPNTQLDNNLDSDVKEEIVVAPMKNATEQRDAELVQALSETIPHERCNASQQALSERSCVCVIIPNINCSAQMLKEAQQNAPLSYRLSQHSCLAQQTLASEKEKLTVARHSEINANTQQPQPTQMPPNPCADSEYESAQRLTEPTNVQPSRSHVQTRSQFNSPPRNSVSQPATPVSARPRSPRSPLAKITRSGGVASADRLRRQVLKRLSTLNNNGRRTLLKEFESTLSSLDFSPQICSTPMHHTPSEDLQKTPPRKTNTPTAAQSNQNVADNPVAEILQHSVSEPTNPQEQPFIRNMVEALEETIKKLKDMESSLVQNAATPASSKNATLVPGTQELLQQAQAQTTASQQVNNQSNTQHTQELLQEVQKALNDLQKTQVQAPKIVIPVNQTFNNAPAPAPAPAPEPAPAINEPNSKENTTVCDSPQTERTLTNKVARQSIPAPSNATYTLQSSIPQATTTFQEKAAEKTRSNLSGTHTQRQTFVKQNKRQTEEFIESLKEHVRQESRSPMRPINQTSNNNHSTNRTIVRSMRVQELNEKRKSLSAINKNDIVLEDLQFSAVHKSPTPVTNSATLIKPNAVSELAVSVGRSSPAHTSRRTTTRLTKINMPTEPIPKIPERLSTAQATSSTYQFTEDEDEEELDYIRKKKYALRHSGPLNLATEKQPTINTRSRRTIKRPLVKRRTTVTSPLITSDTETESGPPPAHPLNLHHAKREQLKLRNFFKRPLNKPPNTPKNGEKFAEELKAHLARLTNHEILDLRKRNSMGKVLVEPTRLRKSNSGKQQVFAEQLQIEEQIQLEILRRDLLGEAEGLHDNGENQNQLQNENAEEIDNEFIVNELPSAPDLFKDNGMTMQEKLLHLTCRSTYNSSLVDDNSNERVSFRSTNTRTNGTSQSGASRKLKNKSEELPEVTKRYIEIQKKVKKRRQPNTSKRSLYSKGDSASESELNACNVSSEKENCPEDITTIEPIPPPPNVSIVYDLQIPSPPPPLAISPPPPPVPKSPMSMDVYLSPPAPFLDNPDGPDENPQNMVNASLTTRVTTIAATNAACQTVDDDAVFKKPIMPAPRITRKEKKATSAKKARTEASTSNATNATDAHSSDEVEGGVRRSKRGQVPRKQSYLCGTPNGRPLLQSLLEEVQYRSQKAKMQRLERSRMSRFSAASGNNNNDMSNPAASSTVNRPTTKPKGRRGKKSPANIQPDMFSYLGETNTTSGTVTSVSGIRENSKTSRLGAIQEAPIEADGGDVGTPENVELLDAPTTSASDIPTKSTKKRAPAKTKATVKTKEPRKRNKSKKKAANVNKNQQPTDIRLTENELPTSENVATETEPIEIPAGVQLVSETGTANRTGLLECSRVYLPPPPPLNKLNEMFDQLKNAANNSSEEASSSGTRAADSTSSSSAATTRKVRVRVRRLNIRETTATRTTASNASSSMSSTHSSTCTQTVGGESGNELLAWLKNVSHLQSATNKGEVYMDMRPSTAGRLFFTDLEGIDYAFYDTVEKCSLGYLRFKPLQSKPLKRTKKYHLHFVVLTGTFQIGTERDNGTFGVGDMVAINIGCRYKITNLDNDIGILMVIKK